MGGQAMRDGWLKFEDRPADFNGPDTPFEPMDPSQMERDAMSRLAQMVERYSDRLAIDDGTIQLSYAETWRAAQNLAFKLDAAAPPGGVAVALLNNSALFPIALLAITLTGRVLVAVDATYPEARKTALIEESGMSVLVHDADLDLSELSLPADTPKVAAAIDLSPGPDFPVALSDPDKVIAVGFTSGSTGRPKGIAHALGPGMRAMARFTNACHVCPDDKILSIASLSVGGTKDAFTALLNGASVRICDIKAAGLAEALRIMGEEKITILSFIPVVIRSVLQTPGAEAAFRHLRVLDLYSDRTLSSDIELFREKLPATCHIRVSLASTEVGSMFEWWVPREAQFDTAAIPVGYPAAGKDLMLLGENGEPVAPGEEGEIVVRSRNMAVGAWQAGELLPGRFLHDADDPQARIYHVGDVVRLRPDGLAEFIGRRDRQIKIRGLKADPTDVEVVLRHLPQVADVTVIARRIGEEEAVLVAFVAPTDLDNPPRPEALRDQLRSELPPHMVPVDYHIVPTIPRLANYKADYLRLSQMDLEALAAAEASAAPLFEAADPSDSIAKARAAVESAWTAVVGKASLAKDEAWSETGADSLKGLKLMLYVEEALGGEAPLELLDHHTRPSDLIADLAAHLAGSSLASDLRRTVFLLPGIAGDEPRLAAFRRALAKEVRFETIAYPDVDEPARVISDWSSIVERALKTIEARQPSGEVALLGYSFGGLVAADLAQRLRAQGRAVALLGAMDTAVSAREGLGHVRGHLMRQLRASAAASGLMVAGGEAAVRWLVDVGAGELVRKALLELRRRGGPHRAVYLRKLLLEGLRRKAAAQSRLQPVDGVLHLFKAKRQSFPAARDLGWSTHAQQVEIIEVEGDHATQFDTDNLQINAERFRSVLAAKV